jgi:hypothetical protein
MGAALDLAKSSIKNALNFRSDLHANRPSEYQQNHPHIEHQPTVAADAAGV